MRKHYPEKKILAEIENTYQRIKIPVKCKNSKKRRKYQRMRKYQSEEEMPAE